MNTLVRSAAVAVALLVLAFPSLAEERQGSGRPAAQELASRPDAGRLPPDETVQQSLDQRGSNLRYTVTAGSLPLMDEQNRVLVEISYIAYVLDGREPGARPLTFAFNGGPGASSAYLHFGALGPRRLAYGNQGDGPSKPPFLVDNPDSWIDFTDLVFVDPVGTGYSRFIAQGENVRRQFWSVDGDARSLSRFVAKYVAKNGRMSSPKYLVGESYGGFRAPKIAHMLSESEGIGVAGIVLVSPVLDFAWRTDAATSILAIASRLPSMVAARLEREGNLSRDRLAPVESYAATEFVVDLMRGPRDELAVERIVNRVAEFTGFDRELVNRFGGRIDMWSFAREFHRPTRRIGSSYDVSVSSPDPTPGSAQSHFEDPVLDASRAPLTSAAVEYVTRVLNWKVDGRYHLLNPEVGRGWVWGSGPSAPQTFRDLRGILAADRKLKVLVAHGFTDLVTPYFATKLVLDQLPALGEQIRVSLEVFPGGHMFYTRDVSRAAFRESVKKLFDAAAG